MNESSSAGQAWAEFERKLASILRALAEDAYLILSPLSDDRYIQFAGAADGGLRIEAVSDEFLEAMGMLPLSSDELAVMAELGWRAPDAPLVEPGAPDESEGSPNFYMNVRDAIDYGLLAELAGVTFQRVYGVAHPDLLRYEAGDQTGEPVEHPALGLPRSLQ